MCAMRVGGWHPQPRSPRHGQDEILTRARGRKPPSAPSARHEAHAGGALKRDGISPGSGPGSSRDHRFGGSNAATVRRSPRLRRRSGRDARAAACRPSRGAHAAGSRSSASPLQPRGVGLRAEGALALRGGEGAGGSHLAPALPIAGSMPAGRIHRSRANLLRDGGLAEPPPARRLDRVRRNLPMARPRGDGEKNQAATRCPARSPPRTPRAGPRPNRTGRCCA